jgi:hypothetical protein
MPPMAKYQSGTSFVKQKDSRMDGRPGLHRILPQHIWKPSWRHDLSETIEKLAIHSGYHGSVIGVSNRITPG